ncbi:MAG: hypothetical protein Q8M31_22955 [Beijerinckiaceae bacterium]|nr:hypothetical protein [Beijerinckiaceae bacterium]
MPDTRGKGAGVGAALDRAVLSAISGFCATLPMTMVMWRLHRRLPSDERYALPPREVSDEAAGRVVRGGSAGPPGTLAAHFGYGAAAGAILGVLAPRPTLVQGAGFGLAIWAGSYFGWIPATGLLKPASDHPRARNSLMLAAHAVWGCSLAWGLRELESSEASFRGREHPDAEKPGRA